MEIEMRGKCPLGQWSYTVLAEIVSAAVFSAVSTEFRLGYLGLFNLLFPSLPSINLPLPWEESLLSFVYLYELSIVGKLYFLYFVL